MKTEQLQNQLAQAEIDYQATCARSTAARAELNALEEEIVRMGNDATAKPAALGKLLQDFEARKIILHAIENDVMAAHQDMKAIRQAIVDHANLQKAKAARLDIAQRELAAMQREYAEREDQLRRYAESIERHTDGIRTLQAELEG